ncbi:BEN domain-containing protein 3 [Sigmodon hispidus]
MKPPLQEEEAWLQQCVQGINDELDGGSEGEAPRDDCYDSSSLPDDISVVKLLYPRAKNDPVRTLEFVGKLDERCWRWNTEQRCSYQLQRKVHVPGPDCRDLANYAINPERFRKAFEGPPAAS